MKAKLGSSLGTTTAYVPGPGNYQLAMHNKRQSPKFGFGSSTRDTGTKTKLNVPGPGAYMVNSTIGQVAKYSMPSRSTEFSSPMKTSMR